MSQTTIWAVWKWSGGSPTEWNVERTFTSQELAEQYIAERGGKGHTNPVELHDSVVPVRDVAGTTG